MVGGLDFDLEEMVALRQQSRATAEKTLVG